VSTTSDGYIHVTDVAAEGASEMLADGEGSQLDWFGDWVLGLVTHFCYPIPVNGCGGGFEPATFGL